MRQSFTAVLEQGNSYEADFATEPYEAGWASEARWFVRLIDASGEGPLAVEATPEISPDGLHWCPQDGAPRLRLSADAPAPRLASAVQTSFGQWLRLAVRLEGARPKVKLLVYVVLKE